MDAALVRATGVFESQLGLATLGQLRGAGVSDSQIKRLVRNGMLSRPRRGVCALKGVPNSWERVLLAAVLAVEGSRASHSAAARLWRFAHRPETRYEVVQPRERQGDLNGVIVHRSTLFEDDQVIVDSVPCTSFERTLSDCTTLLSEFQLSSVLDDGLRRGVASLHRLAQCAEELDSGPGRKMSVVRELLAQRGLGYDPGGSNSERRLIDLFRKARIPVPVQQYRVVVKGKTYILDYAWPALRVFGEWYGLPWHIGASAVVKDNERLRALVAAEWTPLIFTPGASDRQIVEDTVVVLRRRQVGVERSA